MIYCYLNQVLNHHITKYEDVWMMAKGALTTQAFCVGPHEKNKKNTHAYINVSLYLI